MAGPNSTFKDRDNDAFQYTSDDGWFRKIKTIGGTEIPPEAKYVQAFYSNGDKTVTYIWYESSSKVTAYTTITLNFSTPQDTSFRSAEWA